MILIADSGGSKTSWALVKNQLSKEAQHFHSQGLNPRLLSDDLIICTLKDIFKELPGGSIQYCFFYGAGISDKLNEDRMHYLLGRFLPQAQILVAHDLLGAARAGLKNHPGNVLILGTGSNSAYYDGSQIIQQVGGHGYLFGDEAGGAWFGRQFLAATCFGGWSSLEPDFQSTYQKSYSEYRSGVYHAKAPNAALAAIFPWMLKHQRNPEMSQLFRAGVQKFISRSVVAQKRPGKTAVIGSVGFFLQDILAQALGTLLGNELIFVQKPITKLINYHQDTIL